MNYHLQPKRLFIVLPCQKTQKKDQKHLMRVTNVSLFLEVILYSLDYLWESLNGKKRETSTVILACDEVES